MNSNIQKQNNIPSKVSHDKSGKTNKSPINRISIVKTEEQKEIVRTNVFDPNVTNPEENQQFCVVTEVIKRSSNISLDPNPNSLNNKPLHFMFNKKNNDEKISQSKTLNIHVADSTAKKVSENREKYKLLVKKIAQQLKKRVRPPTQGYFYFSLLKGDYPLLIIRKLKSQIAHHIIEFNNEIFKMYSEKYIKYQQLVKKIATLLKKSLKNPKFWNNPKYSQIQESNKIQVIQISKSKLTEDINDKIKTVNKDKNNNDVPKKNELLTQNKKSQVRNVQMTKKSAYGTNTSINNTNLNQQNNQKRVPKPVNSKNLNFPKGNKNIYSHQVNQSNNQKMSNNINPFNAVKDKKNLSKVNKVDKSNLFNIKKQQNSKIVNSNIPKDNSDHIVQISNTSYDLEMKDNTEKNSIANVPLNQSVNINQVNDNNNLPKDSTASNINLNQNSSNFERKNANILTSNEINNSKKLGGQIEINSARNPGKKIEIKLTGFKNVEVGPNSSNIILYKSSNKADDSDNINIESLNCSKEEDRVNFFNKFNIFLNKNNIQIQYSIPIALDDNAKNVLKKSVFWERYLNFIETNHILNTIKIPIIMFIQIIEQYFLWCENCSLNDFKSLIINLISKMYTSQEVQQFLDMNKMNNLDDMFKKYENVQKNTCDKIVEVKLDNKSKCKCDLCENDNACIKKVADINKNIITNVNLDNISYIGNNKNENEIKNIELTMDNLQISYLGEEKEKIQNNLLFTKSKTLHSFESVYQYIAPPIPKLQNSSVKIEKSPNKSQKKEKFSQNSKKSEKKEEKTENSIPKIDAKNEELVVNKTEEKKVELEEKIADVKMSEEDKKDEMKNEKKRANKKSPKKTKKYKRKTDKSKEKEENSQEEEELEVKEKKKKKKKSKPKKSKNLIFTENESEDEKSDNSLDKKKVQYPKK